jgi:hypothetical protein
MTKNNMPRGGLAAFGADLAVLFGAAWYLLPRWALLWVFVIFYCLSCFDILLNFMKIKKNTRYERLFHVLWISH